MRPRPLPVVLIFALMASAIGAASTAAAGDTATVTEAADVTTVAAKKKRKRAPAIVEATMLDTDGNFYADGIELVYSKRSDTSATSTAPFRSASATAT